MSTQNALEVLPLATTNKIFREAFHANPGQALTLFAADLAFQGSQPYLNQNEIDGINSITDAEFDAFARMTAAIGIAPRDVSHSGSMKMF